MVYRPIKKIPNSSDHIVRLNHLDMTSVEMGGRWQKGLAPALFFLSRNLQSILRQLTTVLVHGKVEDGNIKIDKFLT